MSTTRHSFLMEPGRWRAEGAFHDESGHSLRASGVTIVTHGPKEWVLASTTNVDHPRAPTIENNYRIAPFRENAPSTRWRSEHTSLGTLEGTFILVDDVILAPFRSPKGVYSGVESLRRVSATRYETRGMMMKLDVLVSSWAMVLVRED